MLTPLQQSILLNKDVSATQAEAFHLQNILIAVARVCMFAVGLRRQVIAINQDITPQGTPVVPGDSRVWSRKLSDGSTAYALVNLQVIRTCPWSHHFALRLPDVYVCCND